MNSSLKIFFLKIEDKISKIADHFKELCEEGLTSVELELVIKKNCILSFTWARWINR